MKGYKVEDFVDNIKISKRLKQLGITNVNQMIHMHKRYNNSKRDFLFVNALQGKHVAVKPHEFFGLVNSLSREINKKVEFNKDSTVVIGFAETATALGAGVAANLGVYYQQTTRSTLYDDRDNAIEPQIKFSEEHSHAMEQKFYPKCKTNSGVVETIIFVEDEITTGNTIKNFVTKLYENGLSEDVQIIVASVLNWQTEEMKSEFDNKNIKTVALVTGQLKKDTDIMYAGIDGVKFYSELSKLSYKQDKYIKLPIKAVLDSKSPFKGVDVKKYSERVKLKEIDKLIDKVRGLNVLVLGTEEQMYSALILGRKIEEEGINVRVKATTRSPIALYPSQKLVHGYKFFSLEYAIVPNYVYESRDEKGYDVVIVISKDGENIVDECNSVMSYAKIVAHEKIYLIKGF